jgi:hypothetical protein
MGDHQVASQRFPRVGLGERRGGRCVGRGRPRLRLPRLCGLWRSGVFPARDSKLPPASLCLAPATHQETLPLPRGPPFPIGSWHTVGAQCVSGGTGMSGSAAETFRGGACCAFAQPTLGPEGEEEGGRRGDASRVQCQHHGCPVTGRQADGGRSCGKRG